MRSCSRVLVATGIAAGAGTVAVAPAWAQTGGLESPTLWLLVASLAQIIGAAAVVVFFITRGRSRRCPRCGQRLGRANGDCGRCGGGPRQRSRPAKKGF